MSPSISSSPPRFACLCSNHLMNEFLDHFPLPVRCCHGLIVITGYEPLYASEPILHIPLALNMKSSLNMHSLLL